LHQRSRSPGHSHQRIGADIKCSMEARPCCLYERILQFGRRCESNAVNQDVEATLEDFSSASERAIQLIIILHIAEHYLSAGNLSRQVPHIFLHALLVRENKLSALIS